MLTFGIRLIIFLRMTGCFHFSVGQRFANIALGKSVRESLCVSVTRALGISLSFLGSGWGWRREALVSRTNSWSVTGFRPAMGVSGGPPASSEEREHHDLVLRLLVPKEQIQQWVWGWVGVRQALGGGSPSSVG